MANVYPDCKLCKFDCFANRAGKCIILTKTSEKCSMYKKHAQSEEEAEAIRAHFASGRRTPISDCLSQIRKKYEG